VSTQFFSLCSRIEFKEIYFSGDSTDYQEYARVGMYESIPLGAGFKINLQGELSTDVAGRLLLGNNTLVRFEVSDHG